MKSNGCRDVQHTGLQSTQTRRNTGKQGAQTRPGHSIGISSQASLHQWLHCMSNNQANFCKLELICISYNHDAATDVGMLRKICRSSSPALFVHLACQCSFLFVCFVGLYAGHPYIHLISFEIFLLACLCTFLIIIYFSTDWPAHALDTSPAHTCKEAQPVASNNRLAILLATEQAKELCDELRSPRCAFAISIATATSVVRAITQ